MNKLKAEREETMKIRTQINENENIKTIEKINNTKSWFFEVSKTGKPLATQTKKTQRRRLKEEDSKKTKMTKIRKESRDSTTDSTEIKRIVRE